MTNRERQLADTVCKERTGTYRFSHPCGRPAKWVVSCAGAEKVVCGIHVKHYERSSLVLRKFDRSASS